MLRERYEVKCFSRRVPFFFFVQEHWLYISNRFMGNTRSASSERRINLLAWAFRGEIVPRFNFAPCSFFPRWGLLALPIAGSFSKQRTRWKRRWRIIRLDEWDGRERTVVCREEEQVVEKREDERRVKQETARQPRMASMCIVSY